MARKKLEEQRARRIAKGHVYWRNLERFDKLMSTPHPPVKGRQARCPAKRR